MPLVSIIVPNYNHAPYLRQRLDSIFNQTFQDFEVIILDDCSTDNSKEIIEEYGSRPQVSHIIYNETNSGSPFKQRAKGFELAQGEYIWIAESDDWADVKFLETIVPIIQKDPSLSLIYTGINIVYPNTVTELKTYPSSRYINGDSFIRHKMTDMNAIYNASCAIFKRSCLKQISNSYTNYNGCGDWIFWIEICKTGNVYYCSELLDYFRQHNKSSTKKNSQLGKQALEFWNIYQHSRSSFFHRLDESTNWYYIAKQSYTDNHIIKAMDLRKQIMSPFIMNYLYISCFVFYNLRK
ncbi:MAG: glycosyltransferase family 2 protein [Fibrobacter sp.]|nr:glycosyltransferase family 2 protein [Fibrobacter sp.]